MTATEVIPPITHVLGEYWEQPNREDILIDDKTVVMTKATFEKLHEYSATNPSGAYEGKMWRRHDGAFDREFKARGGKPTWMLCWFDKSDKPDHVSTKYRNIVLSDGNVDDY